MNLSLCSFDGGLGGEIILDGVIEVLLAGGLFLYQRCIAVDIELGSVLDGLGVGDVGQVVLRDRQVLSRDGILMVVMTVDSETAEILAGPDIISRGFVYERESEALIEAARAKVIQAFRVHSQNRNRSADWGYVKNKVRDTLSEFIYEKLKRRPMILPLVVEV